MPAPAPHPLGRERTHYWMVCRMAKSVGADVVGAFQSGEITSDDWLGMIERCRGCAWARGCESWLGATGGGSVPRACRNAEVFDTLVDRD